jgi:hypothetical protein
LEKSEGKTPHGRPKHKWQVNIKIDINGTECEGVSSIQLDEDKV